MPPRAAGETHPRRHGLSYSASTRSFIFGWMPQNTVKVPATTGPRPAQGKTHEFDFVTKSHANLLRRWSSL